MVIDGSTAKRIAAFFWLISSASILLAIALSLPIAAKEPKPVELVKEAPVVKRRNLEAGAIFGKAPKLSRGEKGITISRFLLTVRFDIDLLEEKDEAGEVSVRIKPKRINLRLALPITIWTPLAAPEKLRAHEEGHRMIAERIYEDADSIAEFHARKFLDSEIEGRGSSKSEAVASAYRNAAVRLNEAYRKSVYDFSRCVNKSYDEITRHGLEPIEEEIAVNRAFGRCLEYLDDLAEARRAGAAKNKLDKEQE